MRNAVRRSSFWVCSYKRCNSFSIGSKGTGSLLHMAYAINSDRASSLNSLSSYSLSVENKYRFFNCMVFSVMVPVLSRSEEHTSELQSRGHLLCRLLLEKKKI